MPVKFPGLELTQPQIDAAREFANAVIAAFKTERGVHAETAVAGAARMAGTFLLRSFNLPAGAIAPGDVVLSEQANEAGPGLVVTLGGALGELGIPIDAGRLPESTGKASEPALAFLDSQRRLEPDFEAIRRRYTLSREEAAAAAAIAAAFLIHQGAAVLDPHAAFNVAVYGFIEGTKTAPDPVLIKE